MKVRIFIFLLIVSMVCAVGTFDYDESTNVLEVTDGTEGTPATFADMYAADKVGVDTVLLVAENGAADNTLTYQVRPLMIVL